MSSQVTAEDLEGVAKEQKLRHCVPTNLILDKCAGLCNRFPQSPGDFLGRVEAFLLNCGAEALTLELMGKFESFLQRDFQKTVSSPDTVLTKRPALSHGSAPKAIKIETPDHSIPSTPSDDPTRPLEASFSQSAGVPFSQRPNRGTVMLSLNAHLGPRGDFQPSQQRPLGNRVSLSQRDDDLDNIQHRYRYMYTSLEERAAALERHLLRMQRVMCQRAHLAESALSPVGVPSQDVVWVCGRVCCETAQGRLNKASVWLEGSRKESNGRRTQLNLSELPQFSLFPGQVVLVEGVNSSGKRMAVRQIVDGCAPPPVRTAPAQLLQLHHSEHTQGGKAIKMVVACGPFTSSSDLTFAPLEALVMKILEGSPDVVVLLGPFVDAAHPLLATGEVELNNDDEDPAAGRHGASYEMVFVEKVVRDGLAAMFAAEKDNTMPTAAQVVLIPSLADAHHEMVFPQPPFGDRDEVQTPYFQESLGVLTMPLCNPTDPGRRVHLLPNPCMFRVNEVLVGACSSDVLFALSADEASQGMDGGHRLCRLAGHVVAQQSFAPQFPVPPSAFPAQLDFRHSKHWTMQRCPDLLLLPSRLAPMAKEVVVPTVEFPGGVENETDGVNASASVLVVNPGQLVKGRAGGSYAEVHVHPHPETALREAALANGPATTHSVAARSFAQIVKI